MNPQYYYPLRFHTREAVASMVMNLIFIASFLTVVGSLAVYRYFNDFFQIIFIIGLIILLFLFFLRFFTLLIIQQQ